MKTGNEHFSSKNKVYFSVVLTDCHLALPPKLNKAVFFFVKLEISIFTLLRSCDGQGGSTVTCDFFLPRFPPFAH